MKHLLILILSLFLSFPSVAAIVGKSQGTDGALLLLDEVCDKGPGQKLLVINHAAKLMTTGCWVKGNGQVGIWAEGLGSAGIPEEAFEWMNNGPKASNT
jgi:hypothetical protein